jgi:hypothetical protein
MSSRDKIIMVAVIAAAVVLLGLAVISMLSGEPVSFEAIMGSVFAFFSGGAGGWLSRGRNLPKAAPLAVALLACVSLTACSGVQSPPAGACVAETAVVDALQAAHDAAQRSLGGAGENTDVVLEDINRGIAAGRGLVSSCEALRDRAEWQRWVSSAIEIVGGVIGIVQNHRSRSGSSKSKIHNDPMAPPEEMTIALEMLRAQLDEP